MLFFNCEGFLFQKVMVVLNFMGQLGRFSCLSRHLPCNTLLDETVDLYDAGSGILWLDSWCGWGFHHPMHCPSVFSYLRLGVGTSY